MALAATALITLPASTARAQALHGWCGSGTVSTCTDNGTNTPTMQNPPNPFGFTTSSTTSATGTMTLDILVPNVGTAPVSFAITGAVTGTATRVQATPWTSGALDAYLGMPASPNNPIGAFLPAAQALVPAATGFWVYQVSAGTQTLSGASGPPNQLFNITGAVPVASYLVAFLKLNPSDATANSGAIFVTKPGTVTVPEPASVLLLGAALTALCMVRRRGGA